MSPLNNYVDLAILHNASSNLSGGINNEIIQVPWWVDHDRKYKTNVAFGTAVTSTDSYLLINNKPVCKAEFSGGAARVTCRFLLVI